MLRSWNWWSNLYLWMIVKMKSFSRCWFSFYLSFILLFLLSPFLFSFLLPNEKIWIVEEEITRVSFPILAAWSLRIFAAWNISLNFWSSFGVFKLEFGFSPWAKERKKKESLRIQTRGVASILEVYTVCFVWIFVYPTFLLSLWHLLLPLSHFVFLSFFHLFILFSWFYF